MGFKPVEVQGTALWACNQYLVVGFLCGGEVRAGGQLAWHYRIPEKPPEIIARITKTALETGSTCFGPS